MNLYRGAHVADSGISRGTSLFLPMRKMWAELRGETKLCPREKSWITSGNEITSYA